MALAHACFRLAPTPSGFLHRGNGLNFVLTWWFAKKEKASLRLRIDDHDFTRCRDVYLEDIFTGLEWLGLDWDQGPSSVSDHKANFTQQKKREYYREELKKIEKEDLFACRCSRKEIKENNGIHPEDCRPQGHSFIPRETALRLHTKGLGQLSHDFVDCVLWRKEDIPSYQLVSLIEDRDQKTTHLVRGMDLYQSTRFQNLLARKWGYDFPKNHYHHSLLKGEEDELKLSKSSKAPTLREGSPEDFYLSTISTFIGRKVRSSEELLEVDLDPASLFKEKTSPPR